MLNLDGFWGTVLHPMPNMLNRSLYTKRKIQNFPSLGSVLLMTDFHISFDTID